MLKPDMTKTEFMSSFEERLIFRGFMIECGERLICTNTALENKNILKALKAKDYIRVCELLDNLLIDN